MLFGIILKVSNTVTEDRHPEAFMSMGGADDVLPALPKCAVFDVVGGRYGAGKRIPGETCITLAYAPNTDPVVNAIMAKLGALNDLSVDVASTPPTLSTASSAPGVQGLATSAAVTSYLSQKSSGGRVGGAVVFTATGKNSKIGFEVWYNETNTGQHADSATRTLYRQ